MNAFAHDMTPGEWRLLLRICQAQEAMRVSELTEGTGLHPTVTSRILRSLEEKGLVERTLSRADRRVTLVEPTLEGSTTYRETCAHIHRFWEEVFRDIPPEDIDEMLRISEEIMDGMERVNAQRRRTREESDT